MQNEDKFTIALSTLTASISLVDFKTILDIVLIILSIVNLLVIIGVKIVKGIKEKKLDYNDTLSDAKKLNDEIKELRQKLKEKEGEESAR